MTPTARIFLFLVMLRFTAAFVGKTFGWSSVGSRQCGLDDLSSIRGGDSQTCTRMFMLPAAVSSVLAGSVAGAIGVGVAFPLDTLKTKSQVMRQQGSKPSISGSAGAVAVSRKDPSQMNLLQLIGLIYQQEGLAGFFGGVKGMMMGQALIKALAFSANDIALHALEPHTAVLTSVAVLILAACFSGFVTSFLVAPVERIKVMMQASDKSMYGNELDCLKAVVKTEGWGGLLGRGLGPTLAREIPSYGIYFVLYGFMMKTALATMLGPVAPLVFGAMSGMAAWLPVYPIDVVKTLVQNTEGGGEHKSSWEVTMQLYQEGGIGAFFDGLTPKMLRAAVNHSVTFYMYDLVLKALTS